jgi:hypothetical protein
MRLLPRFVRSLALVVFAAASAGCATEIAETEDPSLDQENANGWLARGTVVGKGRAHRGASAALYARAPQALSSGIRGAVLLNPGAVVRAADSVTLAEALANRGYLVYVIDNAVGAVPESQGGAPGDATRGPIPLLSWGFAPALAEQLAKSPRRIPALPEAVARIHEDWNAKGLSRTVAIGHSLGGATLASAVANRNDLRLSKVVLIGVDEFVNAPVPFALFGPRAGDTRVPIVLVRGEKDGLADRSKMTALKARHPNIQLLPDVAGVNHFCIVDGNPGDPKKGRVGAPGKRAADGDATPLDVAGCVGRMVAAIAPALP